MPDVRRANHPSSAVSGAILVINCGSSSVKFALFAADEGLLRICSGAIERIGLAGGHFRASDAHAMPIFDEANDIAGHGEALALLFDRIERHCSGIRRSAVGHRVVHGGRECDCPLRVTAALEKRLRRLIPLAPLHQPDWHHLRWRR